MATDNVDFHFNWVRWANDQLLLVSTRRYRKHGRWFATTRLTAIDRDGNNKIESLVRSAISRQGNGGEVRTNRGDDLLHILPNEPDYVVVAADFDDPGFPSVYRVNINTGRRQRILESIWPIRTWVADPTGNVRLGQGLHRRKMEIIYRSAEPNAYWSTLWEYDLAEGPGPSPVAFWPRPDQLLISAPHNGRNAVFRADVSGPTPELNLLKASDKYDLVPRALLHPGDGNILGVYMAGADKHLFIKPEATKIQRVLEKEMPETFNYIVSASNNLKRYVAFSANGTIPGRYYLGEGDKLTLLGRRYPELERESERLASKKGFEYVARDGKNIEAFLTKPISAPDKPLATIVLPHGGPQSFDSGSFDFWSAFLASRGYAVFQPNFRGSSGYGEAFRRAGYQQWGLEMQDDLSDGIAQLIENGTTDPDRICILGASYGGYAALMGAIKTPELFQCAASLAGVTDLQLFLRHQRNAITKDLAELAVGDAWKDRVRLRQTSPAFLIEDLSVPLLIAHGRRDSRVPYQHAKKLTSKLRSANRDFDFVDLAMADHSLSNYDDRRLFFQKLEIFLDKHLGDAGTVAQ